MVRKISGKNSTSTTKHLIKPDGNKATERQDIADTLAEEIKNNSSSQNYSPKFQKIKASREKRKLNFKSSNLEDYNIPFTMTELKDSLNKAHDTATGPDEIHYQLIKHLPDSSLEVLLDLYNNIWETGIFPDAWREAIVIPIPKAGKDTTNPTNYRPISLTSCLCKTMERMINARLVWFLEKNNIITRNQSGFRHRRSTIDQLIRLETKIRDAFIRKEHMVTIFFDLEKAYDTTWKYGIMEDLHNIGLRGHMPNFIQNFLSGRNFTVRLGTTLSDTQNQEMGVPQGSILSVTLFSIKINSIVEVVKSEIDNSLFVDDFSISYASKSMNTIERQLQGCLNKIQDWADRNGFRFSSTKTVCMHFCQKRKFHLDPDLSLNGTPIPIVTEAKFLGLIFDSKLSFRPHIDYLRRKCQKSLNLLKVVSKLDWGGDRKTLLRIYRSLIRSKLDYGSIIYGSARKSYLQKLEPIQNQALRLCLGAFRTSPIPSLHVEANELPLNIRRDKLALQYSLKLISNPENPAYEITLNPDNTELYEAKINAIPSFGIRIREELHSICPDPNQIALYRIPPEPPWRWNKPDIDLSLTEHSKKTTNPVILKAKFFELKHRYPNHSMLYTDGSKTDDAVAAAAIMQGQNGVQVRLPNQISIFTAELFALRLALRAIYYSDQQRFIIFTDSLSSLMALKGNDYDNPQVLQIHRMCSILIADGKMVTLAWVPSHVGIPGNEFVDNLAKEALDFNEILQLKIPFTDLKPHVNLLVRDHWQALWDAETENKLHSIQPQVDPPLQSSGLDRREEVVLARARIGHTHLTHSCLLKGEPRPECVSCQCPLTVKHILIECADFGNVRPQFFNVASLEDLFNNVPSRMVLLFLKAINLFYRF